ncbi:MAG: lactate racemase [Candidatus Sumerlaeota bacterium]|nr:lactate racemase [Candidatus Sumerlaeota bacterium]
MNVHLPFGSETAPVDVPDNWINGRCYRSFRFDPAGDERAEILAAFNEPVGVESFKALAKRKSSTVVVVDPAYPALFDEFLPAFLEELEESTDIKASKITVLVANSIWMPIEPQALDALIPQKIRKHYHVELHDPFNASAVKSVGKVLGSIDLTVNSTYLDADFKVLCGPVVPDLTHGYQGGRALVLPGLAGEATLRQLYSYENVSKPTVTYGSLQNNPFHAAGMQALHAAGCDLVGAPIVTPDGRLSEFVLGDPAQAFLTAASRNFEKMHVTLKEPMDIVVTCGGGAPYDSTLHQVLNAMAAAEPVLKPNGTIVLGAELAGGFGPDPLRSMLIESASPGGFYSRHGSADSLVPGQWIAQRLFRLLSQHEVLLYTRGMSEDEVWSCGLTPTDNLQNAVELAMQEHGQRCKICALPDGPFSLASVAI